MCGRVDKEGGNNQLNGAGLSFRLVPLAVDMRGYRS